MIYEVLDYVTCTNGNRQYWIRMWTVDLCLQQNIECLYNWVDKKPSIRIWYGHMSILYMPCCLWRNVLIESMSINMHYITVGWFWMEEKVGSQLIPPHSRHLCQQISNSPSPITQSETTGLMWPIRNEVIWATCTHTYTHCTRWTLCMCMWTIMYVYIVYVYRICYAHCHLSHVSEMVTIFAYTIHEYMDGYAPGLRMACHFFHHSLALLSHEAIINVSGVWCECGCCIAHAQNP